MRNQSPLVSVIIPVFRVENYLRKSVQSITNQTYSNLEIILVDDGSDDNCPIICDELAKNDNRIIALHKANGGLSDARNYGLKHATGEYIYFFDSDDLLNKNAIEKLVFFAVEKQASAVAFGYRKINEDGKTLDESHFTPGSYFFTSEKDKVDFICKTLCSYLVGWEAWNRLYRADIIKKNCLRFEPNKEIFAEDRCFNIYYTLCSNDLYVIEDIYYQYLIRDDSIMGRSQDAKVNEIIRLMEYIEKFTEEHNLMYVHKNCKKINVALYNRLLIKIHRNDYDNYRHIWKNDGNEINKRFGKGNERIFIFIKTLGIKHGLASYLKFQRFINAML